MNVKDLEKRENRPIKVLQFGEGNFLRAFVDWIIDRLNEETGFNGNVIMVKPRKGDVSRYSAQDCYYTTVIRGIQDGKNIEDYRRIKSVEKCLSPYENYGEYMDQAKNPDLRFIFSNTTEAGIAYHEGDKLEDKPQVSFPGKVTAFLYERYKHFNGANDKGLIFIPCELIEKGGDTLKSLILRYAREWNLEEGFSSWVDSSCDFCNSLVDRIVPGYPKDEAEAIEKKLGYEDKLLVAAEPFLLWVIECHGKTHEDEFPTNKIGLNVIWTDDMSFYRTRKVRILNGAHTMTVLAAHQAGLDTVEDCIKDEEIHEFMKKGLLDEIIPAMEGDKKDLDAYAGAVLERFSNHHIVHMLLSISLNSVSKFRTRDLPSMLDYIRKMNALPKCLTYSLASLISFYNGKINEEGTELTGKRGNENYRISDSPEVLEVFNALYSRTYKDNEEKSRTIAHTVLSNEAWWGEDLSRINGLEDRISTCLYDIYTLGMRDAMKKNI